MGLAALFMWIIVSGCIMLGAMRQRSALHRELKATKELYRQSYFRR